MEGTHWCGMRVTFGDIVNDWFQEFSAADHASWSASETSAATSRMRRFVMSRLRECADVSSVTFSPYKLTCNTELAYERLKKAWACTKGDTRRRTGRRRLQAPDRGGTGTLGP